MTEARITSYEDVPYESKPLYPTHPDCLGTLATLMGMHPAPPERCRLLELGCATGGNLTPMAQAFPESRFVGIDLSPRQIAAGQAVVDAVGLKNLELKALSITDVDESLGQFDYIVSHGVYSWVPRVVQDKMLDICRRHLAPQGVAYISYNTYPGWHARGMVRDMLGFHVRQFEDPKLRVEQARAFVNFLASSANEPDSPYAQVLNQEGNLLKNSPDYYLFHEHLEDVNQPLYFHEFAERLQANQLQYLGEAWFHTNLESLDPRVREVVLHLSPDLVHLEQYLDFLTNRTFRRTVICHADVKLDRACEPSLALNLQASALARPLSARPDVKSSEPESFRGDDGQAVTTNQPLIKAAFVALFEAWPAALSFDELCADVARRLGQPVDAQARGLLAVSLLKCYLTHVVALHVRSGRMVLSPGERPQATQLARHQAAHEMPVANLRHRIVELSAADRTVLALLDGQRDRQAITAQLGRAVAAGRLETEGEEHLERWLEGSLGRLAKSALLVG